MSCHSVFIKQTKIACFVENKFNFTVILGPGVSLICCIVSLNLVTLKYIVYTNVLL